MTNIIILKIEGQNHLVYRIVAHSLRLHWYFLELKTKTIVWSWFFKFFLKCKKLPIYWPKIKSYWYLYLVYIISCCVLSCTITIKVICNSICVVFSISFAIGFQRIQFLKIMKLYYKGIYYFLLTKFFL